MKVFISYAREDWEIAEKVWNDLKQAGIDAWIDRKELLPGQNWKTEISKAIRASSHFIALLSTRSVSKQGFFQTELKKAIDVLDTFPEYRIYFIPVRIDECEPGYERIGDIHWADLFPSYEDGVRQILRVLSLGNADILSSNNPKYNLRKEPIMIKVSDDEALKIFKLKVDRDGLRKPLEYVKNEFYDNGNATITDYSTGLMWQKSGSFNYMPYNSVQLYINELNLNKFSGYDDWYLPTIEELASLLEQEKQLNNLYISPVFDSKQSWCWTSDQCTSGGWYVYFNVGDVDRSYLYGNAYVRAVRSIE